MTVTPVVPAGTRLPDASMAGHPDRMMSTFTSLLSSRRLIENRRERRGAATPEADGPGQLDRLELERGRWALLCALDNPEFWIAAYTNLLRGVEGLGEAMRETLPDTGPPDRDRIIDVELPDLRAEAADLRRRLRAWQVRF